MSWSKIIKNIFLVKKDIIFVSKYAIWNSKKLSKPWFSDSCDWFYYKLISNELFSSFPNYYCTIESLFMKIYWFYGFYEWSASNNSNVFDDSTIRAGIWNHTFWWFEKLLLMRYFPKKLENLCLLPNLHNWLFVIHRKF
jgi:hypothetical protein